MSSAPRPRAAVLLPLVAVTVAAAGMVLALLNRPTAGPAAPAEGAPLAELVAGITEPLVLISATDDPVEASLLRWELDAAEPTRTELGIPARFALWSLDGDRAAVLTPAAELAIVDDGREALVAEGATTAAWHSRDPNRIAYTVAEPEPALVTAEVAEGELAGVRDVAQVPPAARVAAWDDDGFVLVDTRGSGGVLWLDAAGEAVATMPSVLASAGWDRLLLIPVDAEADPSWGPLQGVERRPAPTTPALTTLTGETVAADLPSEVGGDPVSWGLVAADGSRVALGITGGEGIGFRLIDPDGAGALRIGPLRGRPLGFGAAGSVFAVDLGGGQLALVGDSSPVEADVGVGGVAGLRP